MFALNGVSFIWSAALVVAVRGRAGGRAKRARSPVGAEAAAGVAALFADGRRRLLTLLYIAQATVAGTFQVFIVVTVIEVVGAEESVVGLLTAAMGIEGLVGGALALALVARRRLSTLFTVGLALYSAPLAVVGGVPELAIAFAVLPLASLANTLVDVPATTLMQRLVPDAVTVPCIRVIAQPSHRGLALGALLAPSLVDALGARWALVVVGLSLPTLALLTRNRLREIDRAAEVPAATALFRGVPMFAALPESVLERLAAGSRWCASPRARTSSTRAIRAIGSMSSKWGRSR